MLLYELLNTQLDNYVPILDTFEDQVEELGDIIFTSSAKEVNRMLNEILTAKTSALRLRRILMPQRRSSAAWRASTTQPCPLQPRSTSTMSTTMCCA